jgi:hypothetical protein
LEIGEFFSDTSSLVFPPFVFFIFLCPKGLYKTLHNFSPSQVARFTKGKGHGVRTVHKGHGVRTVHKGHGVRTVHKGHGVRTGHKGHGVRTGHKAQCNPPKAHHALHKGQKSNAHAHAPCMRARSFTRMRARSLLRQSKSAPKCVLCVFFNRPFQTIFACKSLGAGHFQINFVKMQKKHLTFYVKSIYWGATSQLHKVTKSHVHINKRG